MKKVHVGIIIGVILLGVIIILNLSSKRKVHQEVALKVSSLKKAEEAFDKGRLLEAKTLYQNMIDTLEDVDKIRKAQKRVEEINIKVLFSSIMDECSTEYIVNYGDTLMKIAKKFKTTVNLIKRANGLDSNIIRPDQKLKIHTCQVSLVVDKSQNLLFLKRKGVVIKTYVVSTGENNSTPVGTFHIDRNKLVDPTWYKTGAIIVPDDPENVLGSRWMGLEGVSASGVEIKGYGIHGTISPDDLGKQITLGCVRMKNEEVEELFDIVPTGTEVVIID